MRRLCLVPIVTTLLCSCVTQNQNPGSQPTAFAGFDPGVTTLAEVRAALGTPDKLVHEANGDTILVYEHAHLVSDDAARKTPGKQVPEKGNKWVLYFTPTGVLSFAMNPSASGVLPQTGH